MCWSQYRDEGVFPRSDTACLLSPGCGVSLVMFFIPACEMPVGVGVSGSVGLVSTAPLAWVAGSSVAIVRLRSYYDVSFVFVPLPPI